MPKTSDSSEKTKGSPPVWSRRIWTGTAHVEVAIFEKEVTGDAGTFTTHNLSVKRTYKENGDYRSTQGFRSDDVPYLICLLQQAYAFITEQMNKK